jgi:hypothetical protein
MNDYVKAWQCIGCGKIETPQTCIGRTNSIHLDAMAIERNLLMRHLVALIGLASMIISAPAVGQLTQPDERRRELLYSTYCIGCHTTQVHWREKRLATDWTSLKNQIGRWQSNIGLGLGEDDVAAIARHLNRLYYHFPSADGKQSRELAAPRRVAVQVP